MGRYRTYCYVRLFNIIKKIISPKSRGLVLKCGPLGGQCRKWPRHQLCHNYSQCILYKNWSNRCLCHLISVIFTMQWKLVVSIKLWRRVWFPLDWNLERQDWRHRRTHWAMGAYHRHLREIGCSSAVVGRPAAGAESGGKSIHWTRMWCQKVLHSSCCGWRHN